MLKNIDFAGKDLSESSFEQVELEGSNMQNTNLSNSFFIDVDFTQIKNKSLAGANLVNTSLAYANLSGVNLDNAILIGTNLHRADLSGVDFTVTGSLTDGLSFIEANLPNSNFEGVNLSPQKSSFCM